MAGIVIFGASGDLTRRKLVPALYHLHAQGRLPADLHIVGYARSHLSDEEFRQRMRGGIEEFASLDADAWNLFAPHLHYLSGNYDDPADFRDRKSVV